MLNVGAGVLGLAVQIATFALVYLGVAPTRGRSRGLLYAAVAALSGYALALLALATVGMPWQVGNLLLAAALAVVAANRRVRAVMTRTPTAFRLLLMTALPAASIVALLLGVQVVAVVLLPELSIDGQLYHGPVLAQILGTGTLWGWQAPNQYMYYTDLTMLGGVNLASFTGSAVFDNGLQIPHLLLLILALNLLLQKRFARAWVRVAFSALIVSAPVIWLQPRILYVDVAYGAAVATLIVLIVTVRRVGVAEMAVAGISAAAVLATKPTGILTSGVLLVIWIVVAIWRRKAPGSSAASLGTAAWPVILAAAVPMLMGLGFYFRNLVSFGNPVYPVQAEIGPLRLRGIIDLSVFASGDRGSGLFDPGRIISYGHSLATGMIHGVVKADYDPREGGFGFIALAVVILCTAILLAQLTTCLIRRRKPAVSRLWRTQLAVIALVAVVIVIQPSSFDARYVIGPTSVLFAAVLMTSLVVAPRVVDVVAAVCALAMAAAQVVWTEANAYPGLRVAKELRGLTEAAQPMTPGNPWGQSESLAWMPSAGCHSLAVQTNGGVATWGMAEQSQFATLPYGLYGEHLCNVVEPMQLPAIQTGAAPSDPVPGADYLLLYTQDVEAWRMLYPDVSVCWTQIGEVPSSDGFPQAVSVFASGCR